MVKKKIALLGAFGVGKTSLVMQFVRSIFDEKYHTTVGVKIDRKDVVVGGREVTLMIWDTAGEEEGSPVRMSHVAGAAGYLLVVDGCRKQTLDVALSIQERVQGAIGEQPFLLLTNKVDLSADWELQDAELEPLRDRQWTILGTSAKTGEGVEQAFLQLASKILAQADGDASGEFD